mmetsp:Transcript_944/g.1850  ORF Transcript_944/g.1850 Transcript_944/m.1850 type:complete len:209 (+) Transcript_944:853-1479(+)
MLTALAPVEPARKLRRRRPRSLALSETVSLVTDLPCASASAFVSFISASEASSSSIVGCATLSSCAAADAISVPTSSDAADISGQRASSSITWFSSKSCPARAISTSSALCVAFSNDAFSVSIDSIASTTSSSCRSCEPSPMPPSPPPMEWRGDSSMSSVAPGESSAPAPKPLPPRFRILELRIISDPPLERERSIPPEPGVRYVERI